VECGDRAAAASLSFNTEGIKRAGPAPGWHPPPRRQSSERASLGCANFLLCVTDSEISQETQPLVAGANRAR